MEKFFKALAILAALLIAGGGLYLYDGFYGNPVGAWLARREMARHLTETYPDRPFTVQQVHYNFKCGCYVAEVTEAGSDVRFELGAEPGSIVVDDYAYLYLRDAALSERFSGEYREALTALLEQRLEPFWDVFVSVDVPIDRYPPDTPFAPGLEGDAIVQVEFHGERIDRLEFARLSLKARDIILNAGYNPPEMTFLYVLPEKPAGERDPFLYSLRIPQERYAQTAEQAQKDVRDE